MFWLVVWCLLTRQGNLTAVWRAGPAERFPAKLAELSSGDHSDKSGPATTADNIGQQSKHSPLLRAGHKSGCRLGLTATGQIWPRHHCR